MNLATITMGAEKALLSLLLTIHDDKREGWNLAKITTSYLLPVKLHEKLSQNLHIKVSHFSV
jgi:hypothetical protein